MSQPCEYPGCSTWIKLDTQPWTKRRLPGTNREALVCEPCADQIDRERDVCGPDPADVALTVDVEATRQVDHAVRARHTAARRTADESPYRLPENVACALRGLLLALSALIAARTEL